MAKGKTGEQQNIERPEIIGRAYKKLQEIVIQYAQNDVPVLFLGQTGSGKEKFAKLYMHSSKRPSHRQSENCSAFNNETLRSEIFGHAEGAFTGAINKRLGLIRKCENGVLFLDELNSSSSDFQAAILRVTEGNSFRPLGSDVETTVDVTIIAAASNLSSIRKDLVHRFTVVPIPPLQSFDIPELAKHHLDKKPIKREFLEQLMSANYPGNIRELFKTCDKLKVEQGDKIFSNKSTDTKSAVDNFDYDRFEQEFLSWHEFIEPILEKNNIFDIRYKYTDSAIYPYPMLKITYDDLEKALCSENSLGDKTFDVREIGLRDMILLIHKLNYHRQNRDDMLPLFSLKLRQMIAKGELPSLLENLRGLESTTDNTFEKNYDLSHLLTAERPLKEARKEFDKIYLRYHYEKCGNNGDELARRLGSAKSTTHSQLKIIK